MAGNVSLLLDEEAVRNRWFLGVVEAAETVGVSQELVRKAIYRGELRATLFHRRWLITVDDLKEWIATYGQPNVA